MIELLLAAPLTSQETVQGPWRALVRMFAVPVLLLLGMQLVASLLTYGRGGGLFGQGANRVGVWLFSWRVIGVAVAFADLVALGWFGMWMGLVSRNARMATLKTIVFVQVLPVVRDDLDLRAGDSAADVFSAWLGNGSASLAGNDECLVSGTGHGVAGGADPGQGCVLLDAGPAQTGPQLPRSGRARRHSRACDRRAAGDCPQAMTFLPIVERELRVAARRPGTFWLRLLVAFGVIVVAAWIFLVWQNQSQSEVGKVIFRALTGGLMVYCLLAGVRATADCLSEEKREGTLGLLFLTDLRGYDVVFGKLVANSLAVFYGVLAVLPVLAIPLLMGGVTVGEFGRRGAGAGEHAVLLA